MNTASENRHILLQHSHTRLYFIRNGDWTSDPARARDFITMQAATLYSRAEGMGQTQAVVHFRRHEEHDIILPVSYDGARPNYAAA